VTLASHPGGRRVAVAILMATATTVALAGCAGQDSSGTPAQRVASWVSAQGAGSSIGTVGDDLKNVDLALAHHSAPGLIRTACALLTTDASAGNSRLPTPDEQLSLDLSDAYASAYDAGTDCYSGAGGDRALLDRSATERVQSADNLAAALARIRQLTGQVPSTTTTTLPPGSNIDPFAG